jgi:zinc protease
MAIDRAVRPAPGPAPHIRLPRFERFMLRNGMGVLAIRHDDLPEVSARLILPYGAAEDAAGRQGTATMVARALTEGSERSSAREVAKRLDYLGAKFNLEVSYDSTLLSFHFLSRVTAAAFDLLAEIVTQPAFEKHEVERLRDERLDEIAAGMDEPRAIANLRLQEAIFGEHPYAVRTGGIEETVRSLDAAGLAEFHSRFYRPARATLILVGDVPEPGDLRERLETAFGAWHGDAVEPRSLAEPEPLEALCIRAVQWDGPQTEIRLGGLGLARLDPDYHAAVVMNSILGGLFSSRINMNLREDKGWTYGASSRLDARKRAGPFYAATAVDAKASVGAVKEILTEQERMKTDPATDDELELALNALTLSLPRLFETCGQVSGRIAHQVIHGLPDDYWETYTDVMRAVGRDEVQRIAERLLDTRRFRVVVVGPVDDLVAELEDVGPVERRDIHGRPLGP